MGPAAGHTVKQRWDGTLAPDPHSYCCPILPLEAGLPPISLHLPPVCDEPSIAYSCNPGYRPHPQAGGMHLFWSGTLNSLENLGTLAHEGILEVASPLFLHGWGISPHNAFQRDPCLPERGHGSPLTGRICWNSAFQIFKNLICICVILERL